MSYSNINKDRVQVGLIQRLKRALIAFILLVLTISAWINIWQQVSILGRAEDRNTETMSRIYELGLENKKMEKEIEYATSSAYKQRKSREYLGLGGENDNWLLVDLDEESSGLNKQVPESGTKPTIILWWESFVN